MKNFVEKLKIIIDNEGLTASKFSEKIGVQRSSVSHIISGRNKPSLDFILKIKNSIENIDLEWLLSDKIEDNYEKQEETSHSTVTQSDKRDLKSKNIDRIVIFFKDGSFNTYNNLYFCRIEIHNNIIFYCFLPLS